MKREVAASAQCRNALREDRRGREEHPEADAKTGFIWGILRLFLCR